jgi:hypothetical protein
LKVGVIEIYEVHYDVVEGDEGGQNCEDKAEDKTIMVETFDAIFTTGYDAVFWIDWINDLCHDLKSRHSDY